MRALVLLFTLTLSQNLLAAQLMSPFRSTVPGITIRNTHVVGYGASKVLRGQRPVSEADVKQLTDYGINQILIFRNDVQGEDTVATEIDWLNAAGMKDCAADQPGANCIYRIPFKWKEITNFREACEQTVQALKIMKNAVSTPKSSLFFHCTVGEDRTGYLAAMYRMVFLHADVREVFANDMCARGYAEGNHRIRGRRDSIKPDFVVAEIHKAITPVFLKMRELIKSGDLSDVKLDESVCAREPQVPQKLINLFRCGN